MTDLWDDTKTLTRSAANPNAPGTQDRTVTGVLFFTCPKDIAPTKVIGQENFWIRARIAFGDYGQEKVTLTTDSTKTPNVTTVKIDPANIQPPKITSLKIDYEAPGEAPQYCLTRNNLAYSNLSLPLSESDAAFSAFVALDD